MTPPNSGWQSVKRLLAIRLDSMGDVLMTTPALRACKQSFPDLHVTLLTSTIGAQVTPYIHEIDETYIFNAPWVQTYHHTSTPAQLSQLTDELRQQHYDAAIIFTVCTQNPLPAVMLAYQADIPLRLGYSHENPYRLLTDWLPDPEPQLFIRHEVERQLHLVAAVQAVTSDHHLSFSIPATDQQSIQQLIDHYQLDQWLIVHPGAREASRQYPLKSYAEALVPIANQWTGKIVITGTAAESELGEYLTRALGSQAVNLIGQLNLGEFGALIQRSRCLVTNNTGAAHLAAAVGTPVIDLYAATNLQHTPWNVPHKTLYFEAPCKQCQRGICTKVHPLLPQLEPSTVTAVVSEFINHL